MFRSKADLTAESAHTDVAHTDSAHTDVARNPTQNYFFMTRH